MKISYLAAQQLQLYTNIGVLSGPFPYILFTAHIIINLWKNKLSYSDLCVFLSNKNPPSSKTVFNFLFINSSSFLAYRNVQWISDCFHNVT